MTLQPGFPRTQTGVLPKHWNLSSSCKIHSRIVKITGLRVKRISGKVVAGRGFNHMECETILVWIWVKVSKSILQ